MLLLLVVVVVVVVAKFPYIFRSVCTRVTLKQISIRIWQNPAHNPITSNDDDDDFTDLFCSRFALIFTYP